MGQQFESQRTPRIDILRKTTTELTYDAAGNLTQVVETDVLTGKSRTSTLSYDSSGNLIKVEQDP